MVEGPVESTNGMTSRILGAAGRNRPRLEGRAITWENESLITETCKKIQLHFNI